MVRAAIEDGIGNVTRLKPIEDAGNARGHRTVMPSGMRVRHR